MKGHRLPHCICPSVINPHLQTAAAPSPQSTSRFLNLFSRFFSVHDNIGTSPLSVLPILRNSDNCCHCQASLSKALRRLGGYTTYQLHWPSLPLLVRLACVQTDSPRHSSAPAHNSPKSWGSSLDLDAKAWSLSLDHLEFIIFIFSRIPPTNPSSVSLRHLPVSSLQRVKRAGRYQTGSRITTLIRPSFRKHWIVRLSPSIAVLSLASEGHSMIRTARQWQKLTGS